MADIITLTFNKAEYTRLMLSGLLRTTLRPLRVIVVDNGSTDSTPDLLKRFRGQAEAAGIGVEVIVNPANRGAITARNQALAVIESDPVIFIDNDVVPVSHDWAGRLSAFLADHPEAGAVSPRLIYPVPPFLIQCAGCDVAPTGRVNFRGRGSARDDQAWNRTTSVQALITACMAVPLQVVRSVGTFDELYSPVQFEDIDYCYRIKNKGFKLYYTPETEMYHFENVTTSRSATLNPTYNTVKNGLKFKRKWQHVFKNEGGPSEASMIWHPIPVVHIESLDRTLFADTL